MKAKSPLQLSSARWLAYATASAASAVVSGQHSAEGAIHYSGRLEIEVRPGINPHVTFQLDQPGDSIFFERVEIEKFSQKGDLAGFKAVGRHSGFFVGTNISTYSFVYRLAPGYDVGRARQFGSGEPLYSGFGKLALLNNSGHFIFPEPAYLGFTFNNGAGRQYGWARVDMRGIDKHNNFRILGYAYADVGETIHVGETGEETPMRPAEESLGALAFGAVGLVAWRKRRAIGAGNRG